MKKYLVLTSLIFLTNISQAKENISIAFFQARPHIIFNSSSKKISGALYTFLQEYIAPKMEIQFVWDSLPSNVPRQIDMLKKESRDAVALLIYTPDRAETSSFTKKGFFVAKSVIGVQNSNRLHKIEKVEDLLHLKIGYAAKTFLSPFMRDPRINFDFVTSPKPNEINLKKLIAGRIDAIYIPDKAALLFGMQQLNMEKMIRIIELPEKTSVIHVVFTKTNKSVAEKYDRVYKEIDGDRKYRELLKEFLDVNRL